MKYYNCSISLIKNSLQEISLCKTDISVCDFDILCSKLSSLSNLKILTFSMNFFTYYNIHLLFNLSSLEELYLFNCEINDENMKLE